MLRAILKNNLGANHIGTAHKQKILLEAFCNECLQQNKSLVVAGEGPLFYMDAKSVFEEVWHTTLEWVEKRKYTNDLYSTFARVRQCDGVLKEVKNSNKTLMANITELEGNQTFEERGGGNGGVGEGMGTMGQEG